MPTMSNTPTVRAVIERYVAHCHANNIHVAQSAEERQRTFDAFMSATGAWPGKLGDVPVADLQPYYLEDWIAAHQTWRSTSTRKAKANQINAVFNWAAKTRRIADNPFAGINYAEADPRPPMPDDVLTRVMDAASKPLERAMTFLRLTGCRLSELCRLRWEWIDWERAVVRIPADQHKAGRKTRRTGIVALLPETVDLLRKIQAETQRTTGEVFVNSQGTPWTRRTLGQSLVRIKRRLGLSCKATLHGIRHQVGTQAVAAGVPLRFVSRLLGHSSTAITERYYVHDDEDYDAMRQAAEAAKLNRVHGRRS